MSGILLAVDPGLIHPAAALFLNGELQAASRVKVPKDISAKTHVGERCRAIALAIFEWCNCTPDILAIEWPRVYQAGKSKGDPNDLLPLVGIGMCLSGLYPHASLLSPTPSEWIGQVPKTEKGNPWLSPRGDKIRKRLSDTEIAKISVSHDAIDAVGIGLFASKRLDRIRVYESI